MGAACSPTLAGAETTRGAANRSPPDQETMLETPLANLGILAGLVTSLCWSFGSVFFTAAVRRLGPTIVNTYRILLAIVLLGLTHRLLSGHWAPACDSRQVAFLAASGVVGLAIGDQTLFMALRLIGPRISLLIMATGPIFATLFGWLALNETLAPIAFVGMSLTMLGVGWVILERPARAHTQLDSRTRAAGIFWAFVGSACQAGGLLLSKQGMGHGYLPADQHLDPQAATLVRMTFAGLAIIPFGLWSLRKHPAAGHPATTFRVWRIGLMFASLGAVAGPFLGVWMSLVAADHAPVGIAQTLMSLPPIFILPIAVLLYRERISPRAAIGAGVAVSGCALLFVQ
jgi:drug/metabolite transporter (DMT)-like permease